jgi:hypothetical protein
MPIVKVYGMPPAYVFASIDAYEFKHAIRETVAQNLPGMTVDGVSVFFPADFAPYNTELLCIFVDGLFVKPERTNEVRARLARELAATMRRLFKEHAPGWQPKLVECLVRQFNPEDGFASDVCEKPKG